MMTSDICQAISQIKFCKIAKKKKIIYIYYFKILLKINKSGLKVKQTDNRFTLIILFNFLSINYKLVSFFLRKRDRCKTTTLISTNMR